MVGAATTVLTMRPPLTTPARTAAFVSLLCAGASLAASLITLARMSRLSQDNNTSPWASYSRSSEFFPGARRDTESLMVLNVRASFSPPSAALDINPPYVVLFFGAIFLTFTNLFISTDETASAFHSLGSLSLFNCVHTGHRTASNACYNSSLNFHNTRRRIENSMR